MAFTSSSTFGFADTPLLACHAKMLMMLQAGLSPIIFGGVGRAVGNQHQVGWVDPKG